MKSVDIRERIHHLLAYLKPAGWKREIRKIKVKGETFAKSVAKNRAEER